MAEISREIQYVDLDFIFKHNVNTGDISYKSDVSAIKQSVLNILKTNHGEKLFNPYFGANLISFLFENITNITAAAIATNIKDAIYNDEPRVRVLNVRVATRPDRNSVDITVTIQVISTSEIFNVGTTLERIR
jgi:phage baseplate assembly protein W